jgi:hypothetical protein
MLKVWKPFKRFPFSSVSITRLKPGVNEKLPLLLISKAARFPSLRRDGDEVSCQQSFILASRCQLNNRDSASRNGH